MHYKTAAALRKVAGQITTEFLRKVAEDTPKRSNLQALSSSPQSETSPFRRPIQHSSLKSLLTKPVQPLPQRSSILQALSSSPQSETSPFRRPIQHSSLKGLLNRSQPQPSSQYKYLANPIQPNKPMGSTPARIFRDLAPTGFGSDAKVLGENALPHDPFIAQPLYDPAEIPNSQVGGETSKALVGLNEAAQPQSVAVDRPVAAGHSAGAGALAATHNPLAATIRKRLREWRPQLITPSPIYGGANYLKNLRSGLGLGPNPNAD